MSTIHLHQTTTATPEQFVATLLEKAFANKAVEARNGGTRTAKV